jgi:ATP-binding cassette subfamily B protein
MISLISGFGEIGLLGVAFYMIYGGSINISTYIAFTAMLGYFITPIENLVGLQETVQKSMVAAERLSDILEDEETSAALPGEKEKLDCGVRITFENVTFRYGNAFPVFTNLSMEIPIGKHTLIHGSNGCGKSTIAKLIMGLYTCETGSIYFDDVSIEYINPHTIRKSISYVSQHSHFFFDSFEKNILFGVEKEEASLDKAIRTAHIGEMLSAYPDGINTLVEEQGKNLSTGQCQRLALARALVRQPDILILDEATSNIDTETEIAIYEKIRENYPTMTVVTISHKFSKNIKVDNIINLETCEKGGSKK